MRSSRGEMVFYRLKIRSKATNVAEVEVCINKLTGKRKFHTKNITKRYIVKYVPRKCRRVQCCSIHVKIDFMPEVDCVQNDLRNIELECYYQLDMTVFIISW